jgi:chloramphenicol-sensitive protein RarD
LHDNQIITPLKHTKYTLAAISAFIVWGFIVFPLKELSNYASTQILFYRILLALLCLPILMLLFRRKSIIETLLQLKQDSAKDRRIFVLCTLLGTLFLTLNWLSFIYVVNQINIQTASFAYLLCPIITALLGFILLREKLQSQQWLAIGISLGSCCLLGVASLHNLFFSLFVASSYASYLISQRMLKKYDKMVLLTIQVMLSFAVILSLGKDFRGTVPADTHFYVLIFVLSTVFTILPLFLNLFALKELKSATVGVLMYINPLVSFAIAFLYFGEKASITQLMAYGLILLSIIVYNLNFKRMPAALVTR